MEIMMTLSFTGIHSILLHCTFPESFRYCLAYSVVLLLEKELNEFVQYWNSHLIRANRLTGMTSATPNDLYEMPNYHGKLTRHYFNSCFVPKNLGVENYLQDIDINIWMHGMRNESADSPSYYTTEFADLASEALFNGFGICQEDITRETCGQVYCYLVYNVQF